MIVVAGEALIDLIVDPDGEIAAVPGGGPYNTARTIARLGQPVRFLGRVSTDRFGRTLLHNLLVDGVDIDRVALTDAPTTLAVAELDGRGMASYRFYLDGTSASGLTDTESAGILGPETKALHVGTLGLVLEPAGTTIERLVHGAPDEVLVMLDPNCRPSATRDPAAFRSRVDRLARRADVVKVSDEDLPFLHPAATPDTAIDRLLEAGVAVVLCTDGDRSVEVRTATERVSVPVPAVPVVDTVGAGDAFGGGFLAAWARSGHTRPDLRNLASVVEAVRFAIRVASLTCTRPGAEPPTVTELEAAEVA